MVFSVPLVVFFVVFALSCSNTFAQSQGGQSTVDMGEPIRIIVESPTAAAAPPASSPATPQIVAAPAVPAPAAALSKAPASTDFPIQAHFVSKMQVSISYTLAEEIALGASDFMAAYEVTAPVDVSAKAHCYLESGGTQRQGCTCQLHALAKRARDPFWALRGFAFQCVAKSAPFSIASASAPSQSRAQSSASGDASAAVETSGNKDNSAAKSRIRSSERERHLVSVAPRNWI